MIAKQKKLTSQEIQEINETIDIIDISLYDLLVKRRELVANLALDRKTSLYDLSVLLSESIQKITEQRKCDNLILSLTAKLINISNVADKNVQVAIKTKKDSASAVERVLNLMKNIFPFASVEFRMFAKHSEMVNSIATYPNMLAVIPATKTSPKDIWWLAMLSPEMQKIKIINKVPFLDECEDSEYLLACTEVAYNFDRSVVVLATSETTTASWLKTALFKINVPLYNIIDSTAIFNGTVFHLVEISRGIASQGDAIFRLNETVDGINIRMAGYIGGYCLPVVEKDKILKFTQMPCEK